MGKIMDVYRKSLLSSKIVVEISKNFEEISKKFIETSKKFPENYQLDCVFAYLFEKSTFCQKLMFQECFSSTPSASYTPWGPCSFRSRIHSTFQLRFCTFRESSKSTTCITLLSKSCQKC